MALREEEAQKAAQPRDDIAAALLRGEQETRILTERLFALRETTQRQKQHDDQALTEARAKLQARDAEIAQLEERLSAHPIEPPPRGTGWHPGAVTLVAALAILIAVAVTAAVVKTNEGTEAAGLRDQLAAAQRSNLDLRSELSSARQPAAAPPQAVTPRLASPASPQSRSAQEAYQQGVEAAYRYHYTDAMPLFRLAADQGHPAAQYNVGWLYESGLGITKDLGEARRWYKLAADRGFEGAKTALARLGGR